MQILEHQCLHLNNLISYKTIVEKKRLNELIKHIKDNVNSLQLYIKDNILFTASPVNDKLNIEVLVPVTGEAHDCENYRVKSIYKLNNAVVIRHEGCLSEIEGTIDCLNQYIKNKNYQSITAPYCRIIRSDNDRDSIIDIYIGLNNNVL